MGRLSSRVSTCLGWGPNRRKSREKQVLHLPACGSLLVRALVLLLLLLAAATAAAAVTTIC